MPPTVNVPTAPPLARLDRVELARTGTWAIAVGGTQTFTGEDFAAAVAALECPAVRRPIVKLGHLDSRGDGLARPDNDDGEPALGWVANMGLANNRSALVADLVGMPGWLGQIAASAYPDRSIEGFRNYRCQIGHTHPFVLTAVALLGVTPPGIGVLPSLQDHVRALYGVAASIDADTPGGEPVTFTFPKEATVPNPRPELVAAAVTVDELRSAFHQSSPWDYWITEIQLDPLQLIVTSDSNGETYRVPVTIGADGDSFVFGAPVAVEIQYVDETGDEPVAASAGRVPPVAVVFASRAQSRPGPQPVAATATAWPPAPPVAEPPAPPAAVEPPTPTLQLPEPPAPVVPAAEPEPTPTQKGDDVSLSEFRSRLGLPDDADEAAVLTALDERLTPKPDPQSVAAAADRDRQFAAAIQQIGTLSQELAALKKTKQDETKKAFFDAAVAAGRIRPADRGPWEQRYDRDQAMVTEIVTAFAPGSAVPVAAAGRMGSEDDAARAAEEVEFAEFDRMFPPTHATAGKQG